MKRLFCIALLLTGSPSWGAITHVGSASVTGSSGVTTRALIRSAGSTSNLYVMYCTDTASAVTVSNSPNAFVWTPIQTIKTGITQVTAWWAVPSTVASQTITCSGSSGFMNLLLDEWAGTNTSSPIDVSSATTNTTTACSTVGTMSVNDEAVWIGIEDSVTAVGTINGVAASKGADDAAQDWTEYRILSGSGAGSAITGTYTGAAAGSLCITAGILPAGAAVAASTFNKQTRLSRYE